MLKEERHKLIMREINVHNKVLSNDLSAMLNVSVDTVRRDLKELVEGGKILKVHSGAISKSLISPFMGNSEVYAQEAKQQIAAKALSLLKNDMVILTEGGTTMLEFAKAIPDNLHATFLTISPQMAITLSDHPNLTVMTIGGKLNKNTYLHIGAGVVNQLSEYKVDLCLMGANALSIQDGLTDVDWEVVQVKKAIVRAAKKVAVMCISEKLDTVQRITICDIGKIDYLITELPPENPILATFKNNHLTVM
ncbi:MAG: DeoR/GlpR family DNA-binding transcription regulator [Flavitalea sp.]